MVRSILKVLGVGAALRRPSTPGQGTGRLLAAVPMAAAKGRLAAIKGLGRSNSYKRATSHSSNSSLS